MPPAVVRVLSVVLATLALPGLLGIASAPVAGERAAAPVIADVDDFTFDTLDVEYELSRAEDGTSRLTVVETFVAEFPDADQNRGMRRAIPEGDRGVPYFPELVSITDENGRPRPAETDSDDGFFTMTSRADDYVHGRQTYVFTYTLDNVVRFYGDTDVDEFYWNVNGTQWAQPFGSVTMRLEVADDLVDSLTGAAACYVGVQGTTERCEIATDAGVVSATAGPLEPSETMTVAVAFDEATFAEFDSSYFASVWGWLQALAALGVIGAIVWAAVTRSRHLRDGPGRPTIIAEYTPPRDIDALESAVLLHRTTKAIPAEVLEQAVVGSIRIIEGETGWLGTRGKLTAQLVDPSLADGDGRMLLDGLFPDCTPGEEFEFGRSDTRFSSAAQKILKAATTELTTRGLRRPVPMARRLWPILLIMLTGSLSIVFGILALTTGVFFAVPVALIVVAVIAFFVVIGLLVKTPLTAKGAEVRDHLAGLKIFIEWAEADRIRMLQSPSGAERVPVDPDDPRQKLKLYETLLPYAVVFGQEKQWAEHLAVLYDADHSPGWYSGTSGFNAAAFSAGIATLSSSSSSSSSTGGSSGGGSAGGGGGGGGGGGV